MRAADAILVAQRSIHPDHSFQPGRGPLQLSKVEQQLPSIAESLCEPARILQLFGIAFGRLERGDDLRGRDDEIGPADRDVDLPLHALRRLLDALEQLHRLPITAYR